MRSRYDARRTIILCEVHQRTDRMATVPHAGHAPHPIAPIDVHGLLAVARPDPSESNSHQSESLAEDLRNSVEDARVQPRGVKNLFLE